MKQNKYCTDVCLFLPYITWYGNFNYALQLTGFLSAPCYATKTQSWLKKKYFGLVK